MKILIDSISYEEVKHVFEYYPIDGITCNPSIVAKSGKKPYEALKEIRTLIKDKDLHVQVISQDFETIVKEAKRITSELGMETFIKVPVNEVGLKAIKYLSGQGYKMTGTAVYNQMQAILAAQAGALYVAPYFNRIDNLGYDALEVVTQIQEAFNHAKLNTKILGASFKNSKQIVDLLSNGIESVTIPVEMFSGFVNGSEVESAIETFSNDFQKLCGANKTMDDCD